MVALAIYVSWVLDRLLLIASMLSVTVYLTVSSRITDRIQIYRSVRTVSSAHTATRVVRRAREQRADVIRS